VKIGLVRLSHPENYLNPWIGKDEWSCCKDPQRSAPGCEEGPFQCVATVTAFLKADEDALRPQVEQLRRDLRSFNMVFKDELFLQTINIQLAGAAGVGKSSLLQALATAASGSTTVRQVTEVRQSTSQVTTTYDRFDLEHYGAPGPIEIRDVFGTAPDTKNEIDPGKLLDGKIPFGWNKDKEKNANLKERTDATFSDAAHVLVLVVDAEKMFDDDRASVFDIHYKHLMEVATARSLCGLIFFSFFFCALETNLEILFFFVVFFFFMTSVRSSGAGCADEVR
jgi:hypothetical protein